MLNWLKSKFPRRRIDSSSAQTDVERDGFVPTDEPMPTEADLIGAGILAAPATTNRFVVEDESEATPLIGSLAERRRRTADW